MRSHGRGFRFLLAAGVALLTATNAPAALDANPYRVILSHNAFHLRPFVKPEPIKQPEPAPTPLEKVFLTGIVTLSGVKAFLQVEDPLTKKTEFLPPLAVGERYKKITVLGIDPHTQTVRIGNDGAEDTLDFLNDGVQPKTVTAIPPVAVPQPPRKVVAPLPPPPLVAPPMTTPGRTSIVTGGQPETVPANYLNGASRRTGAGLTGSEVEARLGLERERRAQ